MRCFAHFCNIKLSRNSLSDCQNSDGYVVSWEQNNGYYSRRCLQCIFLDEYIWFLRMSCFCCNETRLSIKANICITQFAIKYRIETLMWWTRLFSHLLSLSWLAQYHVLAIAMTAARSGPIPSEGTNQVDLAHQCMTSHLRATQPPANRVRKWRLKINQ